MNTMHNKNHLKPGFSIIEIIVVVLVGGMLAAIAAGGFVWLARTKASDTDRKLVALDAALESYNSRITQYPESLDELISGPTDRKLAARWGESMATEKDLVDGWKQPFVYERLSKGYDLYSIGSKGNAHIRSPQAIEFAQ